MSDAQEAVRRVAEFLEKKISLEELEDWSASFVRRAYQSGDAEQRDIAVRIRSILNAFADDEFEDGLRAELALAIEPKAAFQTSRDVIGHVTPAA